MKDYLSDLNPKQREAVEYGISPGKAKYVGPLVVIAGAGSGKTRVLTHRAAHLLVNGLQPDRILLLAFTRRAAKLMTRRARQIVAKALKTPQVNLPWSGTFHSTAVRLLRQHANRIGLNPRFTVHDRSDSADLMDLVRNDLKLSKKKSRFPRKHTCLDIYSLVINSRRPLEWVVAKKFPWCTEWQEQLRSLFREYGKAKRRQNVLDYDDLLFYWNEMLNDKQLAEEIGGRFDHVLVDEYQDTNRLQAEILLKLKPNGIGLTVVGDDAQAIYSFRAATVRNILEFPSKFTPAARVITLERNYRSTQPILHAANLVMGSAKKRFRKNLFSERRSQQKPYLTTVADEAAQASYVVQRILKAREEGVPLKQQVVLFRAANHSNLVELELARAKIPFVKYGGRKFLEAAHIKDLINILRFCENPRDRVAGLRVLQLLPGIGPSTAAKILDQIAAQRKVLAALKQFAVPNHTAEDWPDFTGLIGRLRKAENWPAEFDDLRTWYEPHLPRLYEDADVRAADIGQLQQIAAGYKSRQRFLNELTIDPVEMTAGHGRGAQLDGDYTVLSTIHSAKGGEWDIVRVLNVVDGCIPSGMATGTEDEIEEERRLLHVAMTRPRNELDLIVPLELYSYRQNGHEDHHLLGSISRFIPKSIHHAFDRRHRGGRASEPIPNKPKSDLRRIDVTERVDRLWR